LIDVHSSTRENVRTGKTIFSGLQYLGQATQKQVFREQLNANALMPFKKKLAEIPGNVRKNIKFVNGLKAYESRLRICFSPIF